MNEMPTVDGPTPKKYRRAGVFLFIIACFLIIITTIIIVQKRRNRESAAPALTYQERDEREFIADTNEIKGYISPDAYYRFTPPSGWWFLKAFEESAPRDEGYLTGSLSELPHRIPLRERGYLTELVLMITPQFDYDEHPPGEYQEYTTSRGYHARFQISSCAEDEGGEALPRALYLADNAEHFLYVKTEEICAHMEHPDLDVTTLMKAAADGFEFTE